MTPADTRPLFRPLCSDVVALFRRLSPGDWERPTVTGVWRVRDVAAHMLDTALRRLSFHRDRMSPPQPDSPPSGGRDFVSFINALNAVWVDASRRLSPRVITDLYEHASGELAAFVESFPDDAPALFPVSWAGDDGTVGLFDIGREFTEIWHHAAQIRDAVDAGPFPDPRWLHAVLQLSLFALPHAYREVAAEAGSVVGIQISGPSGGAWTLRRDPAGWTLAREQESEAADRPTTLIQMTDDTAWRLLYNALPEAAQAERVRVSGERAMAEAFFRTRSVIV